MAASTAEQEHYLCLGENPIRFEPVSKVVNVFFDDANRQVFAVRSGGATGVVVKGPQEKYCINFRMDDRGSVISIKFSPDLKTLAVQRSQTSVEFVNFNDRTPEGVEYSQTCKGKTTRILGFLWTNINEIVFVTDHGIELYQVLPEKKMLRLLKTISLNVNWFVYSPETALLLLSSGSIGNQIHPVQFKPGTLYRLPKFEVDNPATHKPNKQVLLERDFVITKLYGQTCVVILRQYSRGIANTSGAEIIIYTIHRENPAQKTNVLKLDMSGRFAVNIVDNLVIVHHQTSRKSIVFDVHLPGESDGYVMYHLPVMPPLPIQPFKLKVPMVTAGPVAENESTTEVNCELYSPNWVVFQPNIIIDARLGCLWFLKMQLQPVLYLIPDKCNLLDFLLLRQDAKPVVLNLCRQCVSPPQNVPLPIIARMFDKLTQGYRVHLDVQMQGQTALPASLLSSPPKPPTQVLPVLIDQADLYTNVFSWMANNKDLSFKFTVSVLVEYIRALTQVQLTPQHFLHELLINTLVQNDAFYQLQQFLQYQVLVDSKPLACLMLSLSNRYPTAFQLALDMLRRLSTANEQIVEVLLSKKQILQALRFIRTVGILDNVSARKFLEAAMQTGDNVVFYSVFKFFEERNLRLRGNPAFVSGEHCEQYTKYFLDVFHTDSSLVGVLPNQL